MRIDNEDDVLCIRQSCGLVGAGLLLWDSSGDLPITPLREEMIYLE